MAVALRYAARSHLGLGPKGRNEDSGYAGPHLLVLADGMGGHAAGDVASSLIVGALAPLDDEGFSAQAALRVLEGELHDANDALRDAMREDDELVGMGSTTIAMLRAGNKLAMAHIGDSRAYLLRGDELTQITKDHSFAQQLLDEHRISDDEALHHPQRSLVTRVMTGSADDQPDLSIREIHAGDRYLLCSDGLSDFVTAETIGEILRKAATPVEAAERCIEVAPKAHTRDNVPVAVPDVVDSDTEDDPLPSAPEIVGAAAVRKPTRTRTRALPVSPAEKAAALSREATGAPAPDETPTLAEETASPRVVWLRRGALAAAAAVVLFAGLFSGYRWTQQQVFIGEENGYIAIYRGVNQQLGPIGLSTLVQRTDILVSDLPGNYQTRVREAITLASLDEASTRVEEFRATAAACRAVNASGGSCGTGPVTAPTTAATGPDGTVTTPASTLPTVTTGATPPGGIPTTSWVTVTIGPSASPTITVFPVTDGTVGPGIPQTTPAPTTTTPATGPGGAP